MLDVRLTDQPINLIEEGLELGVRIGDLSSSTLVARSVGIAEHLIVATPQYLAAHGEPRHPSDLAQHNCLNFRHMNWLNVWPMREKKGGADGTALRSPSGGVYLFNSRSRSHSWA